MKKYEYFNSLDLTAKQWAAAIRSGKLYFSHDINETTKNTLKTNIYLLNGGSLRLVGCFYSSGWGMSRSFNNYLQFVDKLEKQFNVKFNIYDRKKAYYIGQNYKEL